MAELAISTTALTKDYGSGRGIFDLDLDIPAGEVFGFIGPNGAGKTTTIRLLMDLVRPTRGRARLLGLEQRPLRWARYGPRLVHGLPPALR